MVDAVMKRWGKLTIGVNNAGIALWEAAETMTREQWDKRHDPEPDRRLPVCPG